MNGEKLFCGGQSGAVYFKHVAQGIHIQTGSHAEHRQVPFRSLAERGHHSIHLDGTETHGELYFLKGKKKIPPFHIHFGHKPSHLVHPFIQKHRMGRQGKLLRRGRQSVNFRLHPCDSLFHRAPR